MRRSIGVLLLLACGCGPSVDRELVDRVVYLHGNSSGPCTDVELTVQADGAVERRWNLLNQVGVTAGAVCDDEQAESSAIPAAQAGELLDTVCQSYEETWEESEGCEGAWAWITLYQGEQALVETGNLACGQVMAEAIEALQQLEAP